MIDEILARLIRARKQAGLSQSQVAKMMDVSRTTVTNWEAGSTLTLEQLLKLCEIYDVSECWAMSGVNPNFTDRQRQQVIDAYEKYAEKSKASIDDLHETLDLLESSRQKQAQIT